MRLMRICSFFATAENGPSRKWLWVEVAGLPSELEAVSELDLARVKVETPSPFGRLPMKCGLAYVFSRYGRAEELQYVLDCGAAVDDQDKLEYKP